MSKLKNPYGAKSVDPHYQSKYFKKFLETLIIRRGYDKKSFCSFFNFNYRYFQSQFHLNTKVSLTYLDKIAQALFLNPTTFVKLKSFAKAKNIQIERNKQ